MDPVRKSASNESEVRQQAEKKFLESEDMFRSIVENSHAGIFIIDTSFRLTYANGMLSEILGYPVRR